MMKSVHYLLAHCLFLVGAVTLTTPLALAQPQTGQSSSVQTPATTANVADAPTSPQPTAPPALVPAKYNSPRATILSFLDAIDSATADQGNTWEQVYECLDLSQSNPERAQNTALELWGIFNRLEYIDEFVPLPDAQQVQAQGLTRYTYFPADRFDAYLLQLAQGKGSITLVQDDLGWWRFSAQTVATLHDLYASLEDIDLIDYVQDERQASVSLWLRSKMPKSLRNAKLMTLEYWQWAGLGIAILLGVVLEFIVRFGLRLVANRVIASHRARVAGKTITSSVKPLGLLAAAMLWLVSIHLLGLPDLVLWVLLACVRIITILASTWAVWNLVDLVCEILATKAARTASKFDDVLIPLLRKTVKILIVVFALIYSAGALNIPIMPLLTSLGIGGLAFAFAAKDTIENLFGSVAVLLDRPFEVGDWVVIGDVEGTVEEVGFRSTRIRTFYNSQVTVANATLVRAAVDNYGRRRYRRVKTHIGLQYDTKPDKIIAFTEGIRELVRSHPYTRKDYFQVWLHQLGPSSLDILLYVFHEAPDWSTELRERERLFLDIMRLADQLGVQFAFPTQTVHLINQQNDTPHRPADMPAAPTDYHASTKGIQAAQSLIKDQPWINTKPPAYEFTPTRGGGTGGGGTTTTPDPNNDLAIEDRAAGS